MRGRFWLVSGSLLAVLDVALAAYGAHGLRETLERMVPRETPAVRQAVEVTAPVNPGTNAVPASATSSPVRSREEELAHRLANFDTAVRYQMYHALGLIALGLLMTSRRSRWFTATGWLFLGGVAIFCGLLYALVFSGPRVLGAIVPIGGLAMIAGWVALAMGAWWGGHEPRAAAQG